MDMTETKQQQYNRILLNHRIWWYSVIWSKVDGPKICMLSKLCQRVNANTVQYHLYVDSKKKENKRKIYIAEKEQIHREGKKEVVVTSWGVEGYINKDTK